MLISESRLDTERAGRYLRQLCRHATTMGGKHGHRMRSHATGGAATGGAATGRPEVSVACTDTRGTIDFGPWGRCTIEAAAASLSLRVEAPDAENLLRIQNIVTNDLDRFGRRDGLTVRWHDAAPRTDQPTQP